MIIAISGYSGSGKDLIGKMIQYYTSECSNRESMYYRPFDRFVEAGGGSELRNFDHHYYTEWEVKKFAGKLKDIASMLTGIPLHKFEDQEFKKTNLGPEWAKPIPGEDWVDGKPVPVPMTVRDFLQKLGTDGLRDGLHTNVWVNALFADYVPHNTMGSDYKEDESNWIITDCRFPNEAEAVKKHGGVIVRINRPGNTAVNAHPSETALDDWSFDYTINNDGTIEDLLTSVHTLVSTILVTQL